MVRDHALAALAPVLNALCKLDTPVSHAPSSLHLELDRPDMPRVADLRMVERGDAHGHAAHDRGVVWTSGIKAPRDLERPAAGRPARHATNVGPIAAVLARDEDTGNKGIERKLRIGLRRVRD